MTIRNIMELLDAKVLAGKMRWITKSILPVAAIWMSDVLAYVKDQAVLLTGLVNSQVVRTAEMMDMRCIVFVRNKQPSEEMLELANDSGIVVLATSKRMYEACGKLYSHGLKPEAVGDAL